MPKNNVNLDIRRKMKKSQVFLFPLDSAYIFRGAVTWVEFNDPALLFDFILFRLLIIKYGKELPRNNDPTKHIICPRRWDFKPSLPHYWSENLLEIRHQFQTSILLLN
jgi:hypothetical protein